MSNKPLIALLMLAALSSAFAEETYVCHNADYTQTFNGKGSIYYSEIAGVSAKGEQLQLNEILVVSSNHVEKGEPLVTFSRATDTETLEQKRLTLSIKKRDRDNTVSDYDQKIASAKSNMQSREDEINLALLENERERFIYNADNEISDLENEIAELEAYGNENTLYSPIDGTVHFVLDTSAASLITSGMKLVELHGDDRTLLRVDDPNGALHYGATVSVTAQKGNNTDTAKVISGRVVSADNVLEPNLQSGVALILLDEPADESFNVFNISCVSVSISNVSVVPSDALYTSSGNTYITILDNGNQLQRRVNRAQFDENVAWLLQGVSEGMTIIIDD